MMKQIKPFNLKILYQFHKKSISFLIAFFSIFTPLYSHKAYAENKVIPAKNDDNPLKLAKRFVEKHKEIISILENAGASEEIIKLAERRYQNSMQFVSIIEQKDNPQEDLTSVNMTIAQYKKNMAITSILEKAVFIKDLTALKLAENFAERDKKNMLIFKDESMSEEALNLVRSQYETSMEIVSIVKRHTTGNMCLATFYSN